MTLPRGEIRLRSGALSSHAGRWLGWLLLACLVATWGSWSGCAAGGPQQGAALPAVGAAGSPPPASMGPPGPGDFSAERAWLHLESMVRRGPRPVGGEQAARTRTYLVNRLRASGLQVRTHEFTFDPPLPASSDTSPSAAETGSEPRRAATILAELPGPSEDLILVVAPYTSPERSGVPLLGANAGGSGAAVALELARALAEGARHYTFLFVFVAGDGVDSVPREGSRQIAQHLARREVLARVRAGLFLDRVGDAELVVLRDLHSSAPYRDIVWEQAESSGYAGVFASDGFAELTGGHREFGAAGLRRMVAVIDPAGGGADEEVDELATCSVGSLAAVGQVLLGSLRAIETRLDRMDRYAAAPAHAIRGDARDREAASLDAKPKPNGRASEVVLP